MARNRYGADHKTKTVLEVQDGRSLEEIAAENEPNLNMVRNWKKEYLKNASILMSML